MGKGDCLGALPQINPLTHTQQGQRTGSPTEVSEDMPHVEESETVLRKWGHRCHGLSVEAQLSLSCLMAPFPSVPELAALRASLGTVWC